MNLKSNMLIVLLLLTIAKADQSVIIKDLKDKSIQCDYLLVSPDSFVNQAVRLAEHHNRNLSDDIKDARVVTLTDIYKEFKIDDTIRTYDAIYNALHWAFKNWAEPFTYVVLVGDDSIGNQPNSAYERNRGPMPSFVNRMSLSTHWDFEKKQYDTTKFDTTYNWSDYRYTFYDTGSYQPQSLFMIARIPSENVEQCSLYVDKVISFDSHKKDVWNNNAIFIADDNFQGFEPDAAFSSKSTIEYCQDVSQKFFTGYFVSNIYSSFYQLDDKMEHSAARDDYFSSVNNGAMWTIYIGHGHQSFIADEKIIFGRDAFRFKNYGKNGIFLSLSCENGAYQIPFERSMCKQYLFAPDAGYLVYIASTDLEYASSSEAIADSLFSARNEFMDKPLGYQWWIAQQNNTENHYSFLGDPALTFSSRNTRLNIVPKENGNNSFLCTLVNTSLLSQGSFKCKIMALDSLTPLDDPNRRYEIETIVDSNGGSFNGQFELIVKRELSNQKYKIVVYAWNDSADARGELILDPLTSTNRHGEKRTNADHITINNNVLYLNKTFGSSQPLTMSIYSARGQKIQTQKIVPQVQQLWLGKMNISRGIYFIKIHSVNKLVSCQWINSR